MTKDFLHTVFLDNTIHSWMASAVVVLLALLFSKLISKTLASLCVKFITKVSHENYSQVFRKDIVNPLARFIFWMLVVFAFERLNYPQVLELRLFKISGKPFYFSDVLPAAGHGWLTVCFFQLIIGTAMFVAYILKENADKRNDRSLLQMISLLADLIKAILIIVCILCVLKVSFNYSLSSFVTSLGLVTAALALAAKESVENIICSFVIFLDKPFIVGDSINVGGVSGTVEKIGLRSILLRTDAKTLVSMANRSVVGGTLENISSQTYRRHVQTLELELETNPDDIRKLCSSLTDMLQKKSAESIAMPTVYFKETGVNSHKIYMEYFGQMNLTLAQFRAEVQKINLEIVAIVRQSGIAIIRMNYR